MIDYKMRTDPVVLLYEQKIARALFARELYEEARRVTEGGRTTAFGRHRALYVMWHTTKTDVRDRCIAEAKSIVDRMCDEEWFWKGGDP
jgi:hypothetical protein